MIRRSQTQTEAIGKSWQQIQAEIIFVAIACMNNRRINNRQFAKLVGISPSYWSDIKMLKKPMTLKLIKTIDRLAWADDGKVTVKIQEASK